MTIFAATARGKPMGDLCAWMLEYSEVEVILISLGCLALACLLGYIGVRLWQVMILGVDKDDMPMH